MPSFHFNAVVTLMAYFLCFERLRYFCHVVMTHFVSENGMELH